MQPMRARNRIHPASLGLLAALGVMVLGISIAGLELHRHERQQHRLDVEAELSAVADLKVGQIERWRTERRADAAVILADRPLVREVQLLTAAPQRADLRADLDAWLQALVRQHTCRGAMLLDREGSALLASGAPMALDAERRARAAAAMGQAAISFGDFEYDPSSRTTFLDVIAPLGLDRPVAALLLRFDPEAQLFPLLKLWPTPSATSETLLVRREGGDVLYLNDLRHRPGSALHLRLPMRDSQLPAAAAVSGVQGVLTGRDYRGVPVLAALRQVPDSPWCLVAKTDLAEVEAPLAQRDWSLIMLAVLLVGSAGMGITLLWQRERADFFRRQYKSEMERQALAEHYDYLTRYANDIVLLADGDQRIVEANEKATTVYGYSRAELLDKRVADLRPPELRTELEARLRAMEGGGGMLVETVHQRRDGSTFPVEVSARLIDVAGQRYYQAIIRDITERTRAEELLQEEKERLSVTLRSIGDGVIATDVEGRVVVVNKVAERLTGWTQADAQGRPLADVFHILNQKTRARCENPVDKVIKTGGSIGLANHTVLVSKAGVERVIADSGAPIRDARSRVIGVVLVFRDITEKERTDQELLRSQKLESLALLAGGIAHDFNNILTGVLGYISFARGALPAGDPVLERLREAEAATLRAKGLTQQLLTFSKGGVPVRRPARLGEVIEDAVVFALRGSSVVVEFSIAPDLWPAEIDVGQINQALGNLALNAVQAMPGGGRLRVQAANVALGGSNPFELAAGRYVMIAFQDEGVGIPERLLGRIFDPYFTTKQKGSGLGLASTHSIIKNHDGHIRAESRVGAGSTFTIYLPAADGPVQPAERLQLAVRATPQRVLLMDDEEVVLKLVTDILRHSGVSVDTARDGAEAVDLYREAKALGRPYDVVVMDLTIPGGMGGKEAVGHLRQIDPDVRAIVSSGYSNDPIMASYRDFGFRGVLTKPYRMAEMLDALSQAMSRDQ